MKNEVNTIEIERDLHAWINQFNHIQKNVLDTMCDNCLHEYIRQEEPDQEDFLNDYMLHDEYDEFCKDNDLEKDDTILSQFCEQNNGYDDYKARKQDENFPIWNTCFEFKEEPSEEVRQAAIDAGFGIIEGMEDFNTLLFVAGCGYSFYGQRWMPLFLNLPWNKDLKEKCKGINWSSRI